MISIISVIEGLLLIVPALLSVAFVTIAERKTMASMQRRLGPNAVGYYGLLQAFADALKLLLKEYVAPTQANILLFFILICLVCRSSDEHWAPAGARFPGRRRSVHRGAVPCPEWSGWAIPPGVQQVGLGGIQPAPAAPRPLRQGRGLGRALDAGATRPVWHGRNLRDPGELRGVSDRDVAGASGSRSSGNETADSPRLRQLPWPSRAGPRADGGPEDPARLPRRAKGRTRLGERLGAGGSTIAPWHRGGEPVEHQPEPLHHPNRLAPGGDGMHLSSTNSTRSYFIAVAGVVLATASRVAVDPLLGDHSPFLPFFVAIVLAAWYGGFGPAILAVCLSWLAIDRFHLEPRPGAGLGARWHLVFAFLFVVGLAVALLGESLRAARRRAQASDSEAQRVLEEQRADRERLRTTLASIADAVITTDPEGRITSLNPAAERLTGLGGGGSDRPPPGRGLPPDRGTTDAPADHLLATFIRGGEAVLSDDRTVLVARDRAVRWIEHNTAPIKDERGAVNGTVIVFRDITDRKRSEAALREQAERLQLALDSGRMGTWEWDVRTNRITWSDNLEEIHGLPRGGFDGTFEGFQRLIHPEDRGAVERAINDSIKQGSVYEVEFRNVWPDGSIHWMSGRGMVFTDEGGQPIRMTGTAMDITERKQFETSLREADRRKEEFLAVLSHELRNPLAPIQTSLDMMRQAGYRGRVRAGAVGGRAAGTAPDEPRRWPAGCLSDQPGTDRIAQGDRGLVRSHRRSVEAVRPLIDERRQELRSRCPRSRSGWRPTRRGWSRSSWTCWPTPSSTRTSGVGSGWPPSVIGMRSWCGSGTRGSGSPPRCCRRSSTCSSRVSAAWTSLRAGWGSGWVWSRTSWRSTAGSSRPTARVRGRAASSSSACPCSLGEQTMHRTRRAGPVGCRRGLAPSPHSGRGWQRRRGRRAGQVAGPGLWPGCAGRLRRPGGLDMPGRSSPRSSSWTWAWRSWMATRWRCGCGSGRKARGIRLVAVTGWGQEEDRRRSREVGFDLHLVKPVNADVLKELLADPASDVRGNGSPAFVSGTKHLWLIHHPCDPRNTGGATRCTNRRSGGKPEDLAWGRSALCWWWFSRHWAHGRGPVQPDGRPRTEEGGRCGPPGSLAADQGELSSTTSGPIPGRRTDVAARHPEVVERMRAHGTTAGGAAGQRVQPDPRRFGSGGPDLAVGLWLAGRLPGSVASGTTGTGEERRPGRARRVRRRVRGRLAALAGGSRLTDPFRGPRAPGRWRILPGGRRPCRSPGHGSGSGLSNRCGPWDAGQGGDVSGSCWRPERHNSRAGSTTPRAGNSAVPISCTFTALASERWVAWWTRIVPLVSRSRSPQGTRLTTGTTTGPSRRVFDFEGDDAIAESPG